MEDTLSTYFKEVLGEYEFLGISFVFKSEGKTYLSFSYGTPTSDTEELIDSVFASKQNQHFSYGNIDYTHNYFSITERADGVLSFVKNSHTSISRFTVSQIEQTVYYIIRDYYLTKQRNKLEDDILAIWDILDGSMKHHINNELFSTIGKIDVYKIAREEEMLEEIKAGLSDLTERVNKIFSKKDEIISKKGIIRSMKYYKDNNFIDID